MDANGRTVRSQIPLEGLAIDAEDPNERYHRFTVANARNRADIDVFSTGKVTATGAQSSALEAAERVVARVVPERLETRSQQTFEAGKGDFFGPLVSAAACVSRHTAFALRELGVRDSKKLSDATVRRLADEIPLLPNCRFATELLGATKT